METLSSIFAPFIPAIVACGLLQGILYSIQTLGLTIRPRKRILSLYLFPSRVLLSACAGRFLGRQAFQMQSVFSGNHGRDHHASDLLRHGRDLGEAVRLSADHLCRIASTVIPAILIVYFQSYVERLQACSSEDDRYHRHAAGFRHAFRRRWLDGSGADWQLDRHLCRPGHPLAVYVVRPGWRRFVWRAVPVHVDDRHAGGDVADHGAESGDARHYDFIYPCTAASNAAMAVCALFIFWKAKKEETKSLGLSTGVTALIGVTEPVMFGLIMKYKRKRCGPR